MHTKNTKHTLHNWLSLHKIQPLDLQALLLMPLSRQQTSHQLLSTVVITAEDAWDLAAQAFHQAWPNQRHFIGQAQSQTTTQFHSPTDTPCTTHEEQPGPETTPTVTVAINYQGTADNALSVAHEFGHAVQIHANNATFTPPVLRELAALICELVFLDYLRNSQHQLAQCIETAWHNKAHTYLSDDKPALAAALQDPQALYSYRWNYPAAHILATQLYRALSFEQLWPLIQGKKSLQQCLDNLPNNQQGLRLNNDLPPITPTTDEPAAIGAYRTLGIAALLDLENWQGLAEQPIDQYYQLALTHLQNQTLLAATNKQHQPIGYVTWQNQDKHSIQLTHQAAPFGDHLQLQKNLRSHLPSVTRATAIHSNSARKEQLAWQA